ncbi:hypothetical protein [Chryseobacterium populi]|uniref:Uncharacterized protein n=1 Tax=Chryseobacterium populi TaxID=1144316 RepID=J2KAV8_9FLAO|nr:hypothetical protein [Chryseobacterium populi]EJL70318.1 hypothetical protein PMI13_02860 [Chryseobacterium populi]
MKKLLLLACIILGIQKIQSQVGINTPNPQGILHVDGAKDNNTAGVPTLAQQANDFIITSSGNTGIGTTAPNSTLVIDGTYEGAYSEVSANTALSSKDQFINVVGSSVITLTLPDGTLSNSFGGRIYSIKNTATVSIFVVGHAADQLLRTSGTAITNSLEIKPGYQAKIIKNTYTTVANPLWEVFDLTSVGGNSTDFIVGETKSVRIVINATAFTTASGSRNIMTGRNSTSTTGNNSIYELSSATDKLKFLYINGVRMDGLRSSGGVAPKLFNPTSANIVYNLSALSTHDFNIDNGTGMNLLPNYYSYLIDGDDNMGTYTNSTTEYVNVMITFPNGQWYNFTWHATRDAANFYFYMTAQRLN